jgi:type I restriction enzyme S subunit
MNFDKSLWKKTKLGDVVKHSTSSIDPNDGTVSRYVTGGHIDSAQLKISRWGEIGDGYLGPAFIRPFKVGDVLYGSRRTYLRKLAVSDFEGVCANTTLVLRTSNTDLLKQEFLPFIMTQEEFHRYSIRESKGSVNPYVNWSDLAKYEFLLPPLEVQEEIAKLLWSIENHLEFLRNLTSNSGDLEAQRLQSILTLNGEQNSLGDLLVSSTGGIWGANPGEDEVDLTVIRGTDISLTGDIDIKLAPKRSLRKIDFEKKKLIKGDIVLEKSGGSPDQPVGKLGYVPGWSSEVVASNFCVVLRPDNRKVEPYFLFLILRSLYLNGHMAAFIGKTTNLANLRIPEMLKKKIRIPSRDIQENEIKEYQGIRSLNKYIFHEIRNTKLLRDSVTNAIFEEGVIS